jgi:hypothetical protein
VVFGGGKLTASATLAGGSSPTGTLTFTLVAPDGTAVDAESVTVNGNGTYSTPAGYLPAAAGTYNWLAAYGGDSNNSSASSSLGLTLTSTLTGLSDIYAVAVDAAGSRYVAESTPRQVAVFAPGRHQPHRFPHGNVPGHQPGLRPARQPVRR